MKGCVENGDLPSGRTEFLFSRPDASKLYRIVQRRECSQPIDFFFDVIINFHCSGVTRAASKRSFTVEVPVMDFPRKANPQYREARARASSQKTRISKLSCKMLASRAS